MKRLYIFKAIPKGAQAGENIEGDLIQCDEHVFIFPVGFELKMSNLVEGKGVYCGLSCLVEVDPETVELVKEEG